MLEQVLDCQRRGQPIRVGTVSIEKAGLLSAGLKKDGIKHQVLNARFHEQEAFIIAQSGVPGAVTIATNMAGRGTQIPPGGNVHMRHQRAAPATTAETPPAAKITALGAGTQAARTQEPEAGAPLVTAQDRTDSPHLPTPRPASSRRQG